MIAKLEMKDELDPDVKPYINKRDILPIRIDGCSTIQKVISCIDKMVMICLAVC